ncbi:hypothetical protein CVT25_006791 [Psilocybe cyanescens]|uniref:Uncharacterized protein n=1 Tax=Psilocybe cyanescens TaxID=93625 RepID=A0A409WYH2_PSICY|nr:hypothetical protein CVT25_006791 [Psilocybe cyanescens]
MSNDAQMRSMQKSILEVFLIYAAVYIPEKLDILDKRTQRGSRQDIWVEEVAATRMGFGLKQERDAQKNAGVFDDLRHEPPLAHRHHPQPPITSSILETDTDLHGDKEGVRIPLLLISTDNGEDSEGHLRTHASSSTLVHSHSLGVEEEGSGASEWPFSTAPSSARIFQSPRCRFCVIDWSVLAWTLRRPPNATRNMHRDNGTKTAYEQEQETLVPPGRRNTTLSNSFPNSPNESRVNFPVWGIGATAFGVGVTAGRREVGVGMGMGAGGGVTGDTEDGEEEEEDEVERDLDGICDLEHGTGAHPHAPHLLRASLLPHHAPVHPRIHPPLAPYAPALNPRVLHLVLYVALLSLIVAQTPPTAIYAGA